MSPRPAARRRSLLADLLRSLASLAALLALLVALPVGLFVATRALLPVGLDSIGSASDLLTRQDTGGLALLVLAAVGWIGWAQFAISVLLEIPAQSVVHTVRERLLFTRDDHVRHELGDPVAPLHDSGWEREIEGHLR